MSIQRGRVWVIMLAIWLFAWAAVALGVAIPTLLMAVWAIATGVLAIFGV